MGVFVDVVTVVAVLRKVRGKLEIFLDPLATVPHSMIHCQASRPSRVMCECASANRVGTPRWRDDDGPFGEKSSAGPPVLKKMGDFSFWS